MKRKQPTGRPSSSPVPRALEPAPPVLPRYPTWSAAAILLAAGPACGQGEAPAVEPPGVPPVTLEPLPPVSSAAVTGAALAVGDPCPLHEDGQVLADEPEVAEAPPPAKNPNIRPIRQVRHLAGRPRSVHRVATRLPGDPLDPF